MNEQSNVTVQQAIDRGQRLVNYPLLAILIGTMIAATFFGVSYSIDWLALAGFPLAILLAWLYWSIMITRWKVWAFENVRNVHDLKKRAILEKLIWEDNNFFSKTEIWLHADKVKWANLQSKFNREDMFTDH